VRGRYLLVATGAGRRDRFCVVVRSVAVQAPFSVVNLHGGGQALDLQVAVGAIAGCMDVPWHGQPARQRLQRLDRKIFGEAVAKHAVALG
jgi:hypothetical protein